MQQIWQQRHYANGRSLRVWQASLSNGRTETPKHRKNGHPFWFSVTTQGNDTCTKQHIVAVVAVNLQVSKWCFRDGHWWLRIRRCKTGNFSLKWPSQDWEKTDPKNDPLIQMAILLYRAFAKLFWTVAHLSEKLNMSILFHKLCRALWGDMALRLVAYDNLFAVRTYSKLLFVSVVVWHT